MAKRGGFPGGMGMPGNMNNLMKQAQRTVASPISGCSCVSRHRECSVRWKKDRRNSR